MKNYFLIILSFFITSLSFSQGDDCANAQDLGTLPTPEICGNGQNNGEGTDAVFNLTNVGAIAENPYTSILDCGGGNADQATPAADVWVTFVASGQVLDITMASGLGGANIALYSGNSCGALTPLFCATSNNGSIAETFSSMVPGQQYFMQISGEDETDTAPFTLTLNNYEDCSQCAQDISLTANPPPVNGVYQPGTTVEFCLTVGSFEEIAIHWLHGISPLDLGPGWDAGSMVPTTIGGNAVNWIWIDNNTVPQAGWYVDSDGDGSVDDNFGENDAVNITACWEITTVSAANCNNGASAGMNVETYSDGETGSYTSGSCTGDPITPFNAIVSCCDFPLTSFVNPSCDNIADGSVSATGQGGTAPYDYSWEDAAGNVVSTDNNLADGVASTSGSLLNGTYTVTVTDANGCEKIVDITIAGPVCPPCILIGISANASITCPSATYTTTGTLTFTDPPAGGTLTVSDCNGNSQVFNFPFTSPQNYTLTNQTADGLACDVTAVFSLDPACTITANPIAPICPCNITNFTVNIGSCVPVTNTYDVNGVIEFDMPPNSGTLTITVDNGTTTYDTIIVLANFTSPLNYSISGIVSDGANTTITAVFSADGACTSAIAYVAPVDCACNVEIGTFNTSMNGAGLNDYVLCFGDDFTYASNNDFVPPNDIFDAVTAYDPGIGYLVFSCPPTAGVAPELDPCFEGIALLDGTIIWNDANNMDAINTYPAGTFTNNIVYYVPLTFYNVALGVYSLAIDPCYELGPAVAVQYLPEIKTTDVEDCQAGTITSTVIGGLPEVDGSNYTVVAGSLTPANASFGNTTTGFNGTITITGLTNGQAYSYNIVDVNGCPVTVSGVFVGTEDPGFSYDNYSVCTAGTDPAVAITGDAGTFGFTVTSGGPTLALNTATGAVDASASDPGVYEITYTTTDAICFSDSTITMTINLTPIVDPVADQTVCAGADFTTIVFGSTPGATYTWTNSNTSIGLGANGSGDLSAFTGTNATAVPISGTITVTPTLGACVGLPITFDLIVNPIPVVTAGADQTICTPNAVTLTAGNPNGATISWDNGVTDGTAFNPAVGTITYTVTATLAGCIATDVVDVTVNPLPIVNAGVDQTVCDGTGVTLTATNPDGATITWDNGVNDGIFFVPAVGTTTYTVTADLLGCISTDVMDVIVNPLPVFTVAGTDPTTCGGNDGFITISGLDASTSYQISYNDGAVQGPTAMNSDAGGDIIISGLTAGNYTDFIASLLGCPTTDNTVITLVDPNAPTVNAGADQTICEPGAVTLTATNPDGAVITWDNGVTDGVAFNPAVGTINYTVTATLAGCVGVDDVNVTVNPLPVVNAGVDQTICEGSGVTLTATNPDGAIITWDNAVNDGIFFTPPVGTTTYTVTADLLGCITTDVLDVIVNPLPTFTVAGTDPTTCGGNDGFITISGLNASSAYQITYNDGAVQGPSAMNSDAAGDIIITGLTAGNYTDFIVSLLGCSTTDNTVITLVDPPLPTVNAGIDQTICEPGAVTLTATNPDGAAITWDNGVTDGVAFNPAVGTITYTVTANLANCISTDVVDVIVNPLPVVNAGVDIVICEGIDTMLTANNPDGATITWDNGITDATTFTPPVGVTTTYTVTADLLGCITTDVLDITVNPLPTFTVAGTNPTTCGGNDGFITISGLDVSTSYQITYNDGAVQGPSAMNSDAGGDIIITGLTAGNYTDFIAELLGCPTTDNTIINLVDPSAPTVNAGVDQTICEPGAVTLTATNPDGAVITWDNGVTDGVAFNPAVGTITYTVTANLLGCISTDLVDVTVNPLPIVNAGVDIVICEGIDTMLTANNPDGATITWDNGITDATTFTPPVGVTTTYTVTADLLGCITTDVVDITVNPLPTFTVAGTNPTTCGGNDGFITISGIDVSTSYQITYNDGAVQGPSAMNSDAAGDIIITGLTAGNYTDFIAELLGCPTTDNTIINLVDPSAPTVNAGVDQTICEPGAVTLTATNPDGAVITWDNGVTDGVAFNPAVGTITYTVTANLLGCISTDIVDVIVNPLPIVNAGVDIVICEGIDTMLTANNPDGATITWDNGITDATTFTPPVGVTTTYTVTADLLGCITTDVVDITVNPLPTFTVAGTNPTTCGGNDGFITISGLDASSAYQITYNDGAVQGPSAMNSDAAGDIIITGLTAGNYTDFIASLLGCPTTDNTVITLVDPNAPTVNAGVDQTICEPGAVTLTATNPDGAVITWDNGVTDGVAFNPAVGTITYTVTANLANCISTDVVDVIVNPLPVVNAGADQTVCEGTVVTLIANNPDGAIITWDNGVTDLSPFTPGVGTITYTVTADLLTCITTDVVDITVNQLPTFTLTGTDPTTCGGIEGFITISGLDPSTAYTITYDDGGIVGPAVFNTDAAGEIFLTGLTAGSYTDFNIEILGCSTTDNQVIVLVDPNAPTVNAGVDQTICEPNAVTLTATNPDGATITWDNGITDGTAFNPAVGTITYTVTANLAGCISTDVVDVIVNPLPVVNAGVDQTVCEGTAVTLIANNPDGAIITWDNGVTDLSPFTPAVGTITYTVTADLLTCITTDVVDVTVDPLPTFTVSGTDPVTCGGNEGFITISGLDPSTAYQITYNDGNTVGPNAMNSDAAGEIILTGLFAGNYTDFVVALLGCPTTDNQVIVLVDPNAPTVNAGVDQTICEPGAVTLTATNPDGATITWDNGVTDGIAFNPTVGTLTYTVTANLAGCISNDVVDVTVNPLPVVTAPADAIICDGDVINVVANNPDGATISWDNGVTNGIGFTPAIGTLTYTVTANLLGCITTDVTDITVNPLGDPGFNFPSYAFCSADADPIATIDVPGGSFAFTAVSGGPNLVIDLNTGLIDLDASNDGVYDITYTTVGPCPQDSTVTMTISLTPTVDPLVNDTVCHNEDFTFININGSAGATFDWVNDNPTIGLGAAGNGNTIPTFPGINVTLIPQVANVTITPSAGSCVGTPTTFVLVVNPLDNPGFNFPITDFCTTDANPTPSIDVVGGIFTSFTTQGAGVLDINPATGEINLVNSDAGEYDITYTTAGPDCAQDSTISIIINLTPVINSIPDQLVCEGDQFATVDFTGTANPSFTWTNSNVDIGLVGAGNGDILPWNTTTGGGLEIATITVTPFTATCIGADSTFILSVNPPDNDGFDYPTFNFCTTDAIDPVPTIDVPGGLFTFTVVTGGPNLVIDAATGIIDLDLSDEGVYDVNYETVGPCIQDSTITMTINFTPTVDPLIDQTLCDGFDFNIAPFTGLSGILPTTYNWVNSDPQIGLASPGTGDITSFTATNNTGAQIGGIITVTPSTDECIGTPTTFNLIVDPLDDPSFEYVDGLTYCASGVIDPTVNLTGTAGGTFSFTINSGGPTLIFDTNTGGIDLSASDVGSYEVTYLTNAACPQTSILTLVITDAPVADFTVGDNCANVADEAVVYFNNGSGGVFTAAPAGLVINPATGLVDLDASTAGTYTITNTIDLTAQGCALAVSTDDITIFEIPTALITGTTTICPSDPLPDVTVDFTVNGPYDLDYTFNGNALTEVGTASPFTISNAQFGDYELIQVTDANGCVVDLNGIVSIDSFATPIINQIFDYTVCDGSDLTVDNFSGAPNGNTYDWTISSLTDIGFGTSGTGNIGTFTASSLSNSYVNVDIEVTPTSSNGCVGLPMTFNILVNPLPVIEFSAPVTEGCEPFEVLFNSNNVISDKCFWDFGNGDTEQGCGPIFYTYNTPGVFDVTLTVLSVDNCTASLTQEGYITVSPTPTAAFTFTPQITDISHTEIEFTNNSSPAEVYEWNFGDETSFSNETNPIHTYGDVAQQYEITLIASNNNGLCADTAVAFLTVDDIILYYVPNVFTPDADLYNETFKPIFTSGFDPFDYHLMIFNRWGELIFESYNSEIGWDGTYPLDGQLCQDGVYVWKIEFKETMSDKRHKVVGHVTLLK